MHLEDKKSVRQTERFSIYLECQIPTLTQKLKNKNQYKNYQAMTTVALAKPKTDNISLLS